MNTKYTIKRLAEWIESLKDDAENDTTFDVSWFEDTKNNKFSIVGGWMQSGLSTTDIDIFCLSRENPQFVMAVKIAVNEGPYAYVDFETLNMPVDKNGEVDDTCFLLEWADDPDALAQFIYTEYERISENY